MPNKIDLGRVALVPKGAYDPAVQYERLDLVRYQSKAYLALRQVQGVTPADGEDYMLLVERGEQGPQGVKGDTGNTGPQGERGPAGANGAAGAQGPAGPQGPAGTSGQGVPAGGSAGQVLAKKTASNYDTYWMDPPAGGSGIGMSMTGQTVQPTQGTTVVAGQYAEVFNDYQDRTFFTSGDYAGEAETGNVASGDYSYAEGTCTTASGYGSHAEGNTATASGENSHAEGQENIASGLASHAEGGQTAASESCSHAEGLGTAASNLAAHAEGHTSSATGEVSHAEGGRNVASGTCSHAEGQCTEATNFMTHTGGFFTKAVEYYQTVIGYANVVSTNANDYGNYFIIGNGSTSNGAVTNRANCFRVTKTGVYASGSYRSSGADYAEMFEWADGNPDAEDRAGRFVTLDGAKLRLAGPGDDYIVGIVSGNPSVVGDVHDDQWQGMYLYDIFGRPLWEDVDMPDVTDADGRIMISAHTEHRQKINPDYDNSQAYQPRSERPEWDAVGMLGKLVAVDDGSCVVNGWCAVGEGGMAVKADGRTRYRVMERLDENHIRVLIL